jgi:hypothetical protein
VFHWHGVVDGYFTANEEVAGSSPVAGREVSVAQLVRALYAIGVCSCQYKFVRGEDCGYFIHNQWVAGSSPAAVLRHGVAQLDRATGKKKPQSLVPERFNRR